MKRMRLGLALLLLVCLALPARADITFGTEFTFTNQVLINDFFSRGSNTDLQKGYLKGVRDRVQEKCPKCGIAEITHRGKLAYRVTFADSPVAGAYVDLTMDNGVIEIITAPLTLKQHQDLKGTYRTIVFDQAERAGLRPHEHLGQGHVHIGLKSAFGGDAMLLRNFLVDFYNHPEMGLGVLQDNDPGRNAAQIAELSAETKEAWRKAIAEFDRRRATGTPMEIREFLDHIVDTVMVPAERRGEIDGLRYMGINILNAIYEKDPDKQTLEVRTLRPTPNADSHVLILEMMQKRIEYLKGRKEPLPVELPNLFFPQALAENWEKYLTEMKADVAHFAGILPPRTPCYYYFHKTRR